MRIDRLGNMIVHTHVEAQLAICRQCVGGHGDDGQVLEAPVGPEDARGRHSVHHRHLHIHQHGVVIVLLDQPDGLLAILGQIHEHVGVLELAHGHFLIDLVVLDQKDPRPAQAIDVERRAGNRRLCRPTISAEDDNRRVEQNGRCHRLDQHVFESALLGLFQHLLAAVSGDHHQMGRL